MCVGVRAGIAVWLIAHGLLRAEQAELGTGIPRADAQHLQHATRNNDVQSQYNVSTTQLQRVKLRFHRPTANRC
jgi:hypothetical protein